MPYIGSQPTKVVSQQSSRVYRYTATAGQTVFSGADVDNQVLNVTPSDVEVHMNGLLLDATDYTVTSSSVTLGTAANAGDELTITGMVTFEVADTYDKTTADARYVNASGDTMTGALGIGISPSKNLDVDTTMRVVNQSGTVAAELDVSSGSTWRFRSQPTSGTNAYGLEIVRGSAGTDIKMAIDSAGRVTMPYQPAFRADFTGFGTTPTPVSPTSWTVHFNKGSHFNSSNGRFVAPVAGVYSFSGAYLRNSSAVVHRGRFYVNGANSWNGELRATEGFSGYNEAGSLTMVLQLNANDYVEWRMSSDANASIYGSGYNYFSGYLIG